MTGFFGFSSRQALRTIIASGAILSVSVGFAAAGDVIDQDQIVRALQPKPLTRSLSAPRPDPVAAAAQTGFVDSLRNRRTRSLSLGEREQIAEIASTRPNIDLEIAFDYNSADISATSLPGVQALGQALSKPQLRGSTFVVGGHTDAVGGEAYNQDLSERRADAIKRYLVEKFGIAGADLVTVGYGKSRPKDPAAPMDPSNRRVQVINMTSKTAAN
jgi:outer membrane protein OmpA-like peptidoglycan-associated protein